MKNILQKFYLFSKLSFSISLLLILILFGYLFYRSYSSLSITEDNEAIQKSNLQNSINLNSSRIEKIEVLLSENNLRLNDIFGILDKKNQNLDSKNILKEQSLLSLQVKTNQNISINKKMIQFIKKYNFEILEMNELNENHNDNIIFVKK